MLINNRWYRVCLVLVLLVLTPVTFSIGDGFQEKTVCGEGAESCVRELDSVCTGGSVPFYDHWLM